MRCFIRILDILGRRNSGARHRPVVLEHQTTGAFLGSGAALSSDVNEALVFRCEAEAYDLLTRFGCEPGHFLAVPVDQLALRVA